MSLADHDSDKLVVLYDGQCDLCRKSLRILSAGRRNNLEFVDLHCDTAKTVLPQFTKEELMREIHAVDAKGNVWVGAAAIREILKRKSLLGRLLAILWHIPGYPRLADTIYRWIASHRYGLHEKRHVS